MFSVAAIVIASCIGFAGDRNDRPEVALIIDDVGNSYENGRAAVEIPHAFAYAMLPFSPHAKGLAHMAKTLDKDVLVHLPMEADHDNHLLGPGAMLVGMSQSEIENSFRESIAAVPHAIGVNNHMGSRLTREPKHMRWLMHAIRQRGGLFFVDSRTTGRSIALKWAVRAQIAASFRDVFLDNIQTKEHIEKQLNKLVTKAKQNGHALGIAHPHPLSLEVFRNWDPAAAGVRIVKISEYIEKYQGFGESDAAPLQSRGLLAAECGNHSDDPKPTKDPYTQW